MYSIINVSKTSLTTRHHDNWKEQVCISIRNDKIKPSGNLWLGVKNQVRRSLLAEDSTSDEINCCHLELIDDDDDNDDDDDEDEDDDDDEEEDEY